MTENYYPAYLNFKEAGLNKYFITNINDNKTHILSKMEGDLLKSLSGCRTLESHFENLFETEQYSITSSTIKGTIEKWIKKGFLRNEKLLNKKSVDLASSNNDEIISGCITCNRPDMLEKWFETRINTADYSRKNPTIIICDDTQNNKIKLSNKSIVHEYGEKYSGKIHYIGEKQKAEYLTKLKKLIPEKIPEHVLDFSLSINQSIPGRRTPGTNRNALFLLTAGFNLYTSDDDIEYSFLSKPKESKKYNFPEGKVFIPEFFPDMNTLKSTLNQTGNFNLIQHFEKLINTNISSLIHDKTVSLTNIPTQSAMLIEKNLLQIKAVCLGYFGARWYENPYLPLIQRNNDMKGFFLNQNKYNKIRDNGLNIMAVDNNTLAIGETLMGGTLCLNNKGLTPPCLPQGMRDDTCLSLLLSSCLEPSLALHIPTALYHNPAEKPQFSAADFNDVSANMGDYTIIILEKLSSMLICPAGKERLKEMGYHLKDFGKMENSDFTEQLKLLQLGFLTKKMDYICYLLELYNEEPSWWAEDMKKYFKLLEKEALSSDSVIPRELRVYEDKDMAMEVFKEYIFKCGELLEWWTEIWETARTLNMDGQGIIIP